MGAVAHEPAPLQLECAERPDEFGFLGGPEVRAVGEHDLGDREGIAGVGLAGAAAVALAVGAPGWHLEHLKAGARQRGGEAAPIAA